MSRSHSEENRRRNELASLRGYRNRSEQGKYRRGIRNRNDLGALPPRAAEQRRRSLRVLSRMREDPKLTLAEAAQQEGTNSEAARWYAGSALERRRGRWEPTPGDRLYRPMLVHSEGTTAAIDVRGSHKASQVGAYHGAVRRYLETGDDTALRRFEGKKVAGVPYETDPAVLEEMARRHQLDVDSIYQAVA